MDKSPDYLGFERFDSSVAAVYDRFFSDMQGWDNASTLIHSLSRGGPVLELGIGTGRVALPLKKLGTRVDGIDGSKHMIEVLRAKPEGDQIAVTIGDMTCSDAPLSKYSLVYVVFNTFFDLPSESAQISCISNAASKLVEGGRFLVHCFVPDLTRYVDGKHTSTRTKANGDTLREQSSLNASTQTIDGVHEVTLNGVSTSYPVRLRYCWPAELDSMASLAGLKLERRWADWDGDDFTSNSHMHVSVYTKQ